MVPELRIITQSKKWMSGYLGTLHRVIIALKMFFKCLLQCVVWYKKITGGTSEVHFNKSLTSLTFEI